MKYSQAKEGEHYRITKTVNSNHATRSDGLSMYALKNKPKPGMVLKCTKVMNGRSWMIQVNESTGVEIPGTGLRFNSHGPLEPLERNIPWLLGKDISRELKAKDLCKKRERLQDKLKALNAQIESIERELCEINKRIETLITYRTDEEALAARLSSLLNLDIEEDQISYAIEMSGIKL